MKAGGIIRGLLGGLAAFVVVWVAVVLYWRATDTSPTAGHLVVYLLGLPLLLIGSFVLVRGLMRRRRARAAGLPAATVADAATSTAAVDAPQADRVLHLLASAVVVRAGAGGDAVSQALAQPERPPLHAKLRDRLGLPVFAAAVEDVDTGLVEAALRAAFPDERMFERVFAVEQLRALALLDPVAEELLYAALSPPSGADAATDDATGGLHPHAMHHSRSARAAAPAPLASMLHVRVLLPLAWPEPARRACADWLRDKARAVGFDDAQVGIDVVPVQVALEVWSLLDQLAQAQACDGDRDFHLLLAAHSLIGEASIDRLDAQRDLLISGHPEGLVPGEGAAGLLLAGARLAPNDGTQPVRLHRLVHGQAGRGRDAGRACAALMARALTTAGQSAEAVALVFSDADHRPSRSIEIAGAIATALPVLEPVEHARHLGLACGETGAVAPLAVIAAAAAQVAADGAPVLVVGVADRDARIALALSPMPVLPDNSALAAGAAGAAAADSPAAVAAATA